MSGNYKAVPLSITQMYTHTRTHADTHVKCYTQPHRHEGFPLSLPVHTLFTHVCLFIQGRLALFSHLTMNYHFYIFWKPDGNVGNIFGHELKLQELVINVPEGRRSETVRRLAISWIQETRFLGPARTEVRIIHTAVQLRKLKVMITWPWIGEINVIDGCCHVLSVASSLAKSVLPHSNFEKYCC